MRFAEAVPDYMTWFYTVTKNSKKEERNGKYRGFLIPGLCGMTDAKQRAIKRAQREYGDHVSLQGIAIDEPDRLERLHQRKNAESLLERFNMTEQQAKALCREYGLLSPLYDSEIVRDGCWFCPNQRVSERAFIKKNYPKLWEELEKLSHVENRVSPYFSYGKTFAEVDAEVEKYIHRPIQISFFD